ncbi:ABC transporter ATP-binding protein [Tuberibacillus sp. Marseille-P3662]|uniref:ABC transporter ATP-binding protein n=1 Tax=Tuberibacillus sp. Marseille-P3662 TaxID=1965358 RepID=UPI000A1CB1B4|nr:ABC transporter ATP-binding protein [Tuberibacillus sp. Marseille-P3662]
MLEVEHLNKSFAGLPVLSDISFQVEEGEFVSIIGPSGSGKSTIFNLLTGILSADAGDIHYNQVPVESDRHPFAYMPQEDTLMPWRSVIDNAVLPQEILGANKKEARRRVKEKLPEFGLEGFGDHRPPQISGGMRQRVNLLRTYMFDRDILLLDEPFGSLDAITRAKMHEWLLNIWRRHQKTVLFVTHDIDEALYLSDRVFVLSERPGTIEKAVTVDLTRPRQRQVMSDDHFVELREQLFQYLLPKNEDLSIE